MAPFNRPNNNRRFGGNDSRPSFGAPRFGGGPKKSWGDKRGGRPPMTMHQATCAECNKVCEVPFRPTGDKPVYCKDCFDKRGGKSEGDRGGDRFPKKDFGSRDFAKPHFDGNRGGDDVKKQLEAMNVKLDRLIQVMEKMVTPVAPKSAPVQVKEKTKAPAKKVAKKKTSKK